MNPSVPGPSAPPEGSKPPEGRGHMLRRRWLTATIIVLLIGIPAGYLAISAGQSRASGRDKEERWSATGLTSEWPSRVQRRIYEVPIPAYSRRVAYYETNNWRTSRMYVQFLTSNKGLHKFLKSMDSDVTDLKKDRMPINKRDRDVVGWTFKGEGPFYGLQHDQPDPRPSHDVYVDRSNPHHPMVYVVSTAHP
ncbi:sugar kinase [Streptomyces cavernicola]|uniref:Sugar kinase n=1 Tax=Streptomyces cavernicola TaxID=3043613 RepID=A0ABT6SBE4_9ACTN|nr:sugar kinase [Streptomyces sp. B-S-A6]MDI3405279.1 sugar kinase [Streptomyces sp. B-S-A6]